MTIKRRHPHSSLDATTAGSPFEPPFWTTKKEAFRPPKLFTINGKTIYDFGQLNFDELHAFVSTMK